MTVPCFRPLALFSGASVLLAIGAGCNRLEKREVITETRQISSHAAPARVDISSAARFYDNEALQQQESDPSAPKEHPLVWKTPEGWTDKPSSQMRLIDLSFGPEAEGECYLTAIPGAAGGLAANINRWRSQIGQPPLSDEEIEKLPRKNFLGGPAHYVEIDGDFKGMGSEADAKKGYRLVGMIHQASQLTLFIKMTGPKELLEKNMAAFEAFSQSVDFRNRAGQKIPTH